MTAFQEHWTRIASQLGLKVQTPFHVELAGEVLTVPVLLEEFGAERGMLLVTSHKSIAAVTGQIVDAGFGYSCLDPSFGLDFSAAEIIEMLHDWGWCGSGAPPSWYGA